jgi:hypothetical protein
VYGALYTALAFGEMTKGGIQMAGVWEGFDSGPCLSTQSFGNTNIGSVQSWYTPSLFEAIGGGTNPACPSIIQPPIGTAFPRAVAIRLAEQVFNAGDTVFAPMGNLALWSTTSYTNRCCLSVSVYGARRDSGYGLLFVNPESQWVGTAVSIANDSRTFSASSLVYGEIQYYDINSWAGPDSQSLGTVSGSFPVQLPPESITAITLSATP